MPADVTDPVLMVKDACISAPKPTRRHAVISEESGLYDASKHLTASDNNITVNIRRNIGSGCRPTSPLHSTSPVLRNTCSPSCRIVSETSTTSGRISNAKATRTVAKSKVQKLFESIKRIFTRNRNAPLNSKEATRSHSECQSNAKLSKGKSSKPSPTDKQLATVSMNSHKVTGKMSQVHPEKQHAQFIEETENANIFLEQHKLHSIDGYSLGEVIGTGSFSKVRLGSRINYVTGKYERVAVKMIEKTALSASRKLQESTEREIAILQSLHHPNIVRFISSVQTKSHVCIITNFIDGMELFQLVIKQKRLTESATRNIFSSLVQVVGDMHKNGIAHRDLKLENVMIESIAKEKPVECGTKEPSKLNTDYNVYLIDFGLAHSFNDQILLATRCGSEEYAAPEIIRGLKYNGKKSDIWSLGIILYACLCGNLPFNPDNSSPKSLFDKICNCELKFPSYLSADAKSLIQDLLSVDPNDRPNVDRILGHPFFENKL